MDHYNDDDDGFVRAIPPSEGLVVVPLFHRKPRLLDTVTFGILATDSASDFKASVRS